MKTKFKISTGSFNVERVAEEVKAIPFSIPAVDIDVEVEYSASEMLELWNTTKTVLNESPEVFENFAVKLVECYYRAQKAVMPLHEANRGEAQNESH